MFKERILMANPAMKIIGKASTEYVDSPATLKGTITKAFGLTLVTIASAIASGVFLANSPAAYGVLILGMIVGVVLTLVTCFKPHLAPMTTPGYAVLKVQCLVLFLLNLKECILVFLLLQ